jgi:hypothetical protein
MEQALWAVESAAFGSDPGLASDYMTRPIVTYQPFTGRDGVAVEEHQVVAYAEGQEVARAPLSSPATAAELLGSYEVVDLLPQAVFCYTKHESHIVTVDFSYALPKSRDIHGWVTLEGVRHRWSARWRELPKGSGVIPPDRPWLHDNEIGMGFEFHMPPALSEHPDPVIVRRLTLAIESFIYKIRDGWPVDIPFLYHFDNLFSALTPMWGGEAPAVVTVKESPLIRVIERGGTWGDPSL